MATVTFSVPEDVKQAFFAAFAGENKSALVARLMMGAVANRQAQRRRQATAQLLQLREDAPKFSDDEIHDARRLTD